MEDVSQLYAVLLEITRPAPENDGIVRKSDKDAAESFINFY
ncbi:MAG TPA: hypothetical protein VGR97_10310 [Candidatus Acidoferrales bacterium]|nr:hypothetical protein [Candidatus Acidoferrales bacterium]